MIVASVGHFLLMATLLLMKPSPLAVEGEDEKPADGKGGAREITVDTRYEPDTQ